MLGAKEGEEVSCGMGICWACRGGGDELGEGMLRATEPVSTQPHSSLKMRKLEGKATLSASWIAGTEYIKLLVSISPGTARLPSISVLYKLLTGQLHFGQRGGRR